MKMRKEEISRLAAQVLKGLQARVLIAPRAAEKEILQRIESVIFTNLEEEAAIEEEVKKIMEQYRSRIASGSVDPQKAYMMIKKQVAKDRKFIL